MPTFQLTPQAAQLLHTVQRDTNVISTQVEKAIAQAAQANEQKPLTTAQLEQVLIQAMPESTQTIKDAAKSCSCFHPDGTNAKFLTQILGHRIEKERAYVYNQPQYTRYVRDPLIASFNVDPKSKFVLLFNPRNVDAKGQPLLMKVIAREGADLSAIDFKKYRTQWEKPDVETIAAGQDYVEIKDLNEAEFQFGDPLLQVSVNGKGGEMSRSVAINPDNQETVKGYYGMSQGGTIVPNLNSPSGHQSVNQGATLDRQAVASFADRIALQMKAKDEFPAGGWLDNATAAHVDASLIVGHGYIFEPGATASVAFVNTQANTGVPADDAHLLGSPTAESAINLAPYASWSLRQLLTQNVTQTTGSGAGKSDTTSTNTPAYQLIFGQAKNISVGATELAPLGDRTLNKADFEGAKVKVEKRPLKDDPESDGQRVTLTLDKGFVSAADPASIAGWKIVVGFTNAEGKWEQAEARTIKSQTASGEECMSFDLPNAKAIHQQNKNLEVRLFNAQGVPAERVLIPFRQVQWAADAFAD